ncbi:hypothetical protein DFJ74DRAFT_262703 [Hyaloraphidium curvatum]|nr:hypothetical protein DFJ74DRAFT_262703 [Hyaloraphidium curvatum]
MLKVNHRGEAGAACPAAYLVFVLTSRHGRDEDVVNGLNRRWLDGRHSKLVRDFVEQRQDLQASAPRSSRRLASSLQSFGDTPRLSATIRFTVASTSASCFAIWSPGCGKWSWHFPLETAQREQHTSGIQLSASVCSECVAAQSQAHPRSGRGKGVLCLPKGPRHDRRGRLTGR